MSRIIHLRRLSTLALRQRKALLVRSFALPPHLLHASLLERFRWIAWVGLLIVLSVALRMIVAGGQEVLATAWPVLR